MSRYIDAEELKERIGNSDGFGLIGRCIDEQPTADVIPIDYVKQTINEISSMRLESAVKGITVDGEIYIDSMKVLNILDKLISENENK